MDNIGNYLLWRPSIKVVLENGYYESPLRYDNVNQFVNEIIKLENKGAFYF